jgi:DNA polymerase-1
MEEKQRLALIDLDTLIYIVAYNQHKNGNRDNSALVKLHVKEFISTILVRCRANLVSMVYQDKGHSNFRKYFYPDYKANRPEAPEFIVLWKDTIIEIFSEIGAVGVKVIESDDVLNIGYNRFKNEYDLIIVSGDKDLNQIPGEHYNPRENKSYVVSNKEALYNLSLQLLMGDSTDNVKAIPKMGTKISSKLLNEVLGNTDLTFSFIGICYDQYRKAFGDIWYSEYLKTKFLVTMLPEIDYNSYPFNQEVSELFNIIPCSNLIVTSVFM